MRRILALSLLTTITLCGCTALGDFENAGLAAQHSSIVNGTRATQNTFLTAGQILAVGYLADNWGNPFCTGTLVTDTVVITAGHCTEGTSASSIRFGIGQLPSSPTALLTVDEKIQHPSVDFALLLLGESASANAPGVAPIALNRTRLSSNWLSRWVDASGFGDTYSNATGRFFASVEIESYDAETVTINGHQQQGICYGDSGGPIIWQADATSPAVIVGTEQGGDASCVGRDYLTRVDIVASWIDTQVGVIPDPVDPDPPVLCGMVPNTGTCDAGVALWCQNGGLQSADCSAAGTSCGFLGADVGYDCLPTSCGDLDYFGGCDGAVLSWCSANQGARSYDCATQNLDCVWVSDEMGYNCGETPPPSCDECSGVCTDLETSILHCGACDNPCAPANADGACVAGACSIATCAAGYLDTDGDPSNGCEEAEVQADPDPVSDPDPDPVSDPGTDMDTDATGEKANGLDDGDLSPGRGGCNSSGNGSWPAVLLIFLGLGVGRRR